ncbi:hypothetical protein [Plantibacter sp. YIM 135347]|uniref:hypothetical protein n=1 Tax=Plantibacter sp. YIM 135347 TaxID=3423919 RepID=UPI003D32BE54
MALILLLVLSAIGQQCSSIPASVGTAASTSTSLTPSTTTPNTSTSTSTSDESVTTDSAQASSVHGPATHARTARIASPSAPTDNQLGIPGCEGRDDAPAPEPDLVRTAPLWDVTAPTTTTVETVTASAPDDTTPRRLSDHVSSPTPQELCISRT